MFAIVRSRARMIRPVMTDGAVKPLASSSSNNSSNNNSSSSSSTVPASFFSTTTVETPSNNVNFKLYQYAICPFCNIAKSILHYQNIPYEAIEVNPLTKNEIKQFAPDYKKVPIMTFQTKESEGEGEGEGEEKRCFGSEGIVDTLKQEFMLNDDSQDAATSSSSASAASSPMTNGEISQHWEQFARNDLAPLLYPNLCNTLGNSYKAFDYVHSVDSFSTLQKFSIQSIGSFAMYMAASKIKKKRNITDEKQALHDALQLLEDHLSSQSKNGNDGSNFLDPTSNNVVSLGDLTVYGVMRGLEGLPVHEEIMEGETYAHIPNWYQRMKETVES